MPGPVSSTAKNTCCASSQADSVMLPPPGVNFSELPIRLVMTRSSRIGSAVNWSLAAGAETESLMFLGPATGSWLSLTRVIRASASIVSSCSDIVPRSSLVTFRMSSIMPRRRREE